MFYLLQQQTRPHTKVAMATTIMNDAIVTYNTLHSEIEEKSRSTSWTNIYVMFILCNMYPFPPLLSYYQHVYFLTTIALSIGQLSSDEVFHPEGVAHTATGERVTLSMAGAV